MLRPIALVLTQAVADTDDGIIAGIGTGGELTLTLLLAIALVGGVVAMVAGDRAKRRDRERSHSLLSRDARGD